MSPGVEKTTQSGINHIDQLISHRKWALDEDRTITWTITKEDAIFADEPYGIRAELPYFRAISSEKDIANINMAMDVYNSVLGINLKYIDERTDGEATIRFNAYDAPVSEYAGGGWAYGPYTQSWGGDVWSSWNSGYTTAFALHELGHVFALDHPGHTTGVGVPGFTTLETIMSYSGGKKLMLIDENGKYVAPVINDSLGIYDIAALQYLYGANTSHNADDTVYKYDPSTGFYTTIWDAGGEDTLDLSDYRRGSHISLKEGTYTSVNYYTPSGSSSRHTYTGENAIGIAYGVVIENAIGTQGDDIILGNSAANKLIGNEGNDTLFGYEGDDWLEGGDGDDVLDGGAGADTMIGGLGDDTYYVDDIDDVVNEAAGAGNDTVIISIDSTSIYKFSNVENFIALEGGATKILTGNPLDNVIIGNSASNRLMGHHGDDTLIGGKGDDTLCGGLGNDTFVFFRGDGKDQIVQGTTTPNEIDTLSFRGDVVNSQLWFRIDSKMKDLIIEVIGTSDSVTVKGFFSYRDRILDWIEDGSGNTLSTENVDKLVNAMAAFAPPALGQTALSKAQLEALAPTIASAWTSSTRTSGMAETNDSVNYGLKLDTVSPASLGILQSVYREDESLFDDGNRSHRITQSDQNETFDFSNFDIDSLHTPTLHSDIEYHSTDLYNSDRSYLITSLDIFAHTAAY